MRINLSTQEDEKKGLWASLATECDNVSKINLKFLHTPFVNRLEIGLKYLLVWH